VRGHWLALLALDARLSGVVRSAREPVLGQLKLAWWRERLGEDPARWPRGEPLLAALRELGEVVALAALVDGWEALLAAPPLGEAGLLAVGTARGEALRGAFGSEAGADLALGWGLGTMADFPLDPDDRAQLGRHIAARNWRHRSLPGALRPLLVLHHFAARAARGQGGGLAGAIRLGLIGR
jgi:phytoene synthase